MPISVERKCPFSSFCWLRFENNWLREERKAMCVAYSSSRPAFVNSCRNNYISSFKGTFSHALYGMKAEDARCFWLGMWLEREGETNPSEWLHGGRSWQVLARHRGVLHPLEYHHLTQGLSPSHTPQPHSWVTGFFSQFLGIFLGNPEFLPLDTIAPGCPPHLNSAILDLKRLRLTHLQIFFLGSDNDSSFRARWRPRRWLGDRNGSHVSRRKVVGCQSCTSNLGAKWRVRS